MEKRNEALYLSTYFVGTPHSEYLFKTDFTVRLTNEATHLSKVIVDADGNIMDFPGIDYTAQLTAELGHSEISPVVKYEAAFEKTDAGTFRMVWTVRPDGRFWMDSWGFGAEDYESLSLYSYLDESGHFTAPFRLYAIGRECYGERRLRPDEP